MSKEEASVEDLSQTTSPPLYFACCPFVSVLFLLHPYSVFCFLWFFLWVLVFSIFPQQPHSVSQL